MAIGTQYRGKSLEHKIHHLKQWATKRHELIQQGAEKTKEGRKEIGSCNRQITKIQQSIPGIDDYNKAQAELSAHIKALRNQ